MADNFVTTEELAELLTVTPRTVERWRAADAGPPFVTIGGTVRYPREALTEWLAENVTIPTRPSLTRARAQQLAGQLRGMPTTPAEQAEPSSYWSTN